MNTKFYKIISLMLYGVLFFTSQIFAQYQLKFISVGSGSWEASSPGFNLKISHLQNFPDKDSSLSFKEHLGFWHQAAAKNIFNIIATVGTYGTITPSGEIVVNYGQDQIFTITPVTGAHLDSLLVDGNLSDSTTSYTFFNVTSNHTIEAYFSPDVHLYQVNAKWNLVSVPLTMGDYSKTVVYPTATSGAFKYSNGYAECDTLVNGAGYWLKFGSAQDIAMAGLPHTQDSIAVQSGWNLIGSLSSPVATSSITSNPGGITTSNFYGYENGYVISDTIVPGKAYWVKVNQSGTLLLSTSVLSSSNTIRIVPTSELPPSPPREELSSLIPETFALEQNYPNPFNPVTVIQYAVPSTQYVSLKVYNVLGQVVATLVNGVVEAGYKSAVFDANTLPSGVYIYLFTADTFRDVRKSILLK